MLTAEIGPGHTGRARTKMAYTVTQTVQRAAVFLGSYRPVRGWVFAAPASRSKADPGTGTGKLTAAAAAAILLPECQETGAFSEVTGCTSRLAHR
jgi:hypothetical protein